MKSLPSGPTFLFKRVLSISGAVQLTSAVVALLLVVWATSACGNDPDEPKPSPSPTQRATDTGCPSNVGTTIRGAVPSPFPTPDEGTDNPVVLATPSQGGPGTVVSIEGYAFNYCFWERTTRRSPAIAASDDARVYLIGYSPSRPGCEVVVNVRDVRMRVSRAHHLEGSFVVGDYASCKQARPTASRFPPPSARYEISLGCYACTIGEFHITGR